MVNGYELFSKWSLIPGQKLFYYACKLYILHVYYLILIYSIYYIYCRYYILTI